MIKKTLAAFLAMTMAASVLAGCAGNGSSDANAPNSGVAPSSATAVVPEGGPAKEFTIACRGSAVNPAMEDWWLWKKYEEKTGIHINWIEIPDASVAEKKTLMLAGNDIPDAFWQIDFTSEDLSRYGSEGTFVNLAPYLEEHAPSVTKLLDGINGGKAAVTMADGGVYSLPWVQTDLARANLRYYINKTWLDNVKLEVPTTVDELTAAFKAFKEQDANGNGDPNDEHPIYEPGDKINGNLKGLEQQLCGSFGIGNNGLKPLDEYYYVNDQNKVEFLYTSDGMKQIWQQFSKWWDAGYFHPDSFGNVEYEKRVTDGSVNHTVGLFSWAASVYLYYDAFKEFTPIHALKGPNGKEPVVSWTDHPIRTVAAFTITKACKDPATLLNWADYFYSEEGVTFGALGVEGETFNKNETGEAVYTDDILSYEGGPQLGAFQKGLLVYGGGLPIWNVDCKTLEIARKQNLGDFSGEIYSPYSEISKKILPDLLPAMVPTVAEAGEIPALKTDIKAYFLEARMNFTTGKWNFEGDWDNYVKKMQQMGSNRYTEIKQAQYDRFLEINK